jgi:hypothetical protein
MDNRLYAKRNPYEEQELFAMLERMRRQGDMDAEMDQNLGELIIAVTRFAMTCGMRKGIVFRGDDAESQCMVYALEASRKADTSNPRRFVNYMVNAVQRNWVRDSMTEANRNKLLFPIGDSEGIELSAGMDGTPEGIPPWECLRLFTIKNKEAEDGNQTLGRCNGRSEEVTGNPDGNPDY